MLTSSALFPGEQTETNRARDPRVAGVEMRATCKPTAPSGMPAEGRVPGGSLAESGAIHPLHSGQLRPGPRRATEQASEQSRSLGLSWAPWDGGR